MGITVSNVHTWTSTKILEVTGDITPTEDHADGGYISGGVYPDLVAWVPNTYDKVCSFKVEGFGRCDASVGTGMVREKRYTAEAILHDVSSGTGVAVSIAWFDGATELAAGQGYADVRAHFPAAILGSPWRFHAVYSKP